MTLGLIDEACPVSLDRLGALYRADDEALGDMLDAIPEATRARLAVYLYGRSHTRELGLRAAATCSGAELRRAAGLLGNAIHEMSRQPHQAPSYGDRRTVDKARISLGGTKVVLADCDASLS